MSLARGVNISALGNLLPPIVGLIVAPILAQHLGPDGRGEVAAATTPLLLAAGIATFGIPELLTFTFAGGTNRRRRFAIVTLLALGVFGLLASAVVFLSADMLAAGDVELAKLISLVSLVISPTLIIAGLRGIALGRHLWWVVSADRMAGAAGRLVAVTALALQGSLNVETASWAIALSSLVGLPVYLALAVTGKDHGSSKPLPDTVGLVRFAAHAWGGSLSGILLARISQVMILPLAGAGELGLFVVAVTVSEATLVLNSAVRDVIFAAEAKRADISRTAAAARVSTVITAVGSACVVAVSIWAIPVLFGAEFAESVVLVGILAIGVVLGNPGSIAGAALVGRGRPGLRSVSLLTALVLNVTLLVVLVPTFGAVGACAATVAGNIVAGWLNVVWVSKVAGCRVWAFLGIRRDDLAALARVVSMMLVHPRAPTGRRSEERQKEPL